jgi:bifunctional non-homologous end joining protein LigD
VAELLFQTINLAPRTAAFDDPEWVFEVKHDGYRCLAFLEDGAVRLVSRRGRELTRYAALAAALSKEINARSAVIDGELAVLDGVGRSLFAGMRRREPPVLIAFDLLALDGDDFRNRPLVVRKATLRRILPKSSAYILYLQHIEGRGQQLFKLACENDLEGIVAKKASDPYDVKRAKWWKIKCPAYSRSERVVSR